MEIFLDSEVQSSRQSAFKHLYRSTQDPVFLILEKHAALAAVEIAEASKISQALGIPYHNLGKYYFEVKEYAKSATYFKKAVENLTTISNSRHGHASVIADIKGHQYAAEYHNGDKSALDRALQALEELIRSQEDSTYNKNAWVSGAHLRIAEMLKTDDPIRAREHLRKAQEIIASDNRQILRKEQLERLQKAFNS